MKFNEPYSAHWLPRGTLELMLYVRPTGRHTVGGI